jgi:hypothetical protein
VVPPERHRAGHNGFADRFLWASVRRSNVIPDPTGIPAQTLEPLV